MFWAAGIGAGHPVLCSVECLWNPFLFLLGSVRFGDVIVALGQNVLIMFVTHSRNFIWQ